MMKPINSVMSKRNYVTVKPGDIIYLVSSDFDDYPDDLQQVNLPLVSSSSCADILFDLTITDIQICAGGTDNGGTDVCQVRDSIFHIFIYFNI